MRAIVVADGDVDAAALRRALDRGDDAGSRPLVIAADGGALKAEGAGVVPDLVIGDGDSLPAGDRERLIGLGVSVRVVPASKDESDTELCLREALVQDATEVTLFGALGGPRPEHALANISLLALAVANANANAGRPAIVIEHGDSTIRLMGDPAGPSELHLEGRPGDYVSLLPQGDGVEGVTTDGLRYALYGESLPFGPSRGLSNELAGTRATINLGRGWLLVVHTRREESP